MNKIDVKHKEITTFLIKNADEKEVKFLSRYFKEGLDAYGIEKNIFKDQLDNWIESWKNEMTLADYLELGDSLILTGKLEKAGIATQLTLSKKDDFTKDTFDRVGQWLENGIQNWANTDVLCMVVLCVFVYDEIVNINDFAVWNNSPSKWKRRAVPVTFVEIIKKGYQPEPMLEVIEPLMEDKEEDVQKGLGTFLREVWKKNPQLAEVFLMKWKETCGRKIIQYATEKMTKEQRLNYRRTKKKK